MLPNRPVQRRPLYRRDHEKRRLTEVQEPPLRVDQRDDSQLADLPGIKCQPRRRAIPGMLPVVFPVTQLTTVGERSAFFTEFMTDHCACSCTTYSPQCAAATHGAADYATHYCAGGCADLCIGRVACAARQCGQRDKRGCDCGHQEFRAHMVYLCLEFQAFSLLTLTHVCVFVSSLCL